MGHFGTYYLSHMSAAVSVGNADTQERPQNVVAENPDVARIGADGREVRDELTLLTTIAGVFVQSTTALTTSIERLQC